MTAIQLCVKCGEREVELDELCLYCLEDAEACITPNEDVDTRMRRTNEGRRIIEGFSILSD